LVRETKARIVKNEGFNGKNVGAAETRLTKKRKGARSSGKKKENGMDYNARVRCGTAGRVKSTAEMEEDWRIGGSTKSGVRA